MKRLVPVLTLFVGLALGVILHAFLLPLFSGVHEVVVFGNAKAPPGFIISPAEASFIVVNLKQGLAWGMTTAQAVFVDSENYYVITGKDGAYQPDSWIKHSDFARLHGYSVNGKTGKVRAFDWENVGFLLMTLDEIREKFPEGTPREQVSDSIGWGYDVTSQSNQESHVYYLQKEGECVIIFEDAKLKSVKRATRMHL